MTEKLFTETLNKNQNKQKNTAIVLHDVFSIVRAVASIDLTAVSIIY